MQVITDYKQAGFLLDCKKLAVDVETNTTPPPDSGWKDQFGVSYCTDITYVSFYVANHPPVAFPVPPVTGSLTTDSPAGLDTPVVAFIRDVLSREDLLIIGHNVVFDLRVLGGHYGFNLHPTTRVFDTSVIAQRMLLQGVGEHESSWWGNAPLDLFSIYTRFGWKDVFHENDRDFYSDMKKKYRASEADLRTLFSRLDSDPDRDTDRHFWTPYMQGAVHAPGATDLFASLAEIVFLHYVAMDTVIAYRIYLYLSEMATVLVQRDYVGVGLRIPKWSNLLELLRWEVRISAASAQQAIVGVRLDTEYATQQSNSWQQQMLERSSQLVDLPDLWDTRYCTDPDWHKKFQILLWWTDVLDCLRAKSSKKSLSNYTLYGTWEASTYWPDLDWVRSLIRVPDEVSQFLGDGAEGQAVVDEYLDYWAEYLTSLPRNATTSKLKPTNTIIPSLPSLLDWVYETQFAPANHPDGRFMASLKMDWLRVKYTQREELSPNDTMSKKAFKPYLIYVVCGLPIPTDDVIEYNWLLVTDRVKSKAQEYYRTHSQNREYVYDDDGEIVGSHSPTSATLFPWRETSKELNAFSLSADAIGFLIKNYGESVENSAPAKMLEEYLQALSRWSRAEELLLHAQRDGRIHSVVSRRTATGRFTSTTPNLQNIDMDEFRGFLIADEGFVNLEGDFANAENKTGAMFSGDNHYAQATEGGDFHSAQAKIYFPHDWEMAEKAGDTKTLLKIRKRGKAITFAGNYGAGAYKLGVMIGADRATAEAILRARDEAYPTLTKAKQDAIDLIVGRYKNHRYNPAFVSLWSGSRALITSANLTSEEERRGVTRLSKVRSQARRIAWNYIQQGGVAEMVSRAIVEINRYLYENGFKSFVLINVHDSIILSCWIPEVDTILPVVCQIMGDQVDVSLRRRTRPFIHFVTEFGPENAQKWGWRSGHEYPLSLDYFYNRWGKFRLPDEILALPPANRESPTWVVNESVGDTLELEMARTVVEEQLSSVGVVVQSHDRWAQLMSEYKNIVSTAEKLVSVSLDLSFMQASYTLTFVKDGRTHSAGPFDFTTFMNAVDYLVANGYNRSELTNLPTWDEINNSLLTARSNIV